MKKKEYFVKRNIYNIYIGDSQSSIYHDISFYIHDSQLMANCQCVVFIKSKEERETQKEEQSDRTREKEIEK